jgi:hypothetical protein
MSTLLLEAAQTIENLVGFVENSYTESGSELPADVAERLVEERELCQRLRDGHERAVPTMPAHSWSGPGPKLAAMALDALQALQNSVRGRGTWSFKDGRRVVVEAQDAMGERWKFEAYKY